MTRKRLSGFQKLLCDYERGSCSLEQMGRDTENDDGVWSTSIPYLVPNDNAQISKEQKQNFPETGVVGVPTP